MTLPRCGACRAMLAILTTSLTLALPMVVRAAAEETPPPIAGDAASVAPASSEGVPVESAEERVAALEARVEKLERELRQLRAATQSAAAALASAAGGGDSPVIGSSGGNGAGNNSSSMGNIAIAESNNNRSSAGSVAPARGPLAQQEAREHFSSLSEESKKDFYTEMRVLVESMPNASSEERAEAVRGLMKRLHARDAAMKKPVGDSGAGSGSGTGIDINISGSGSNNNTPAPLPQMPEVKRTLESIPAPPAAAESTPVSHDETRSRFEALHEEQRNRFINEMRNNREKLRDATPGERDAIVKDVLAKLEKESAASSPLPVPADTPATPPAPAKPSKEPGKKK